MASLTAGTVLPGDSISVSVEFTPAATIDHTDSLTIFSNDVNEPQKEVFLFGSWNRIASHSPQPNAVSVAAFSEISVTFVVDMDPATMNAETFQEENYPNPFDPTTFIRYDLPAPTEVELRIYDVLGKEVKTLIHRHEPAGVKMIEWDATNSAGNPVRCGVYFVKIKAGAFQKTLKMLLIDTRP